MTMRSAREILDDIKFGKLSDGINSDFPEVKYCTICGIKSPVSHRGYCNSCEEEMQRWERVNKVHETRRKESGLKELDSGYTISIGQFTKDPKKEEED